MRKRNGRSINKGRSSIATVSHPHLGSADLLALLTIAMLGGQAWQHLTTSRDGGVPQPQTSRADLGIRRLKPGKRR
jgi:hypothetical protein